MSAAAALTLALKSENRSKPAAAHSLRKLQTVIDTTGECAYRIHAYRNGPSTAPRLILIHGSPGSCAGWADYLLKPPAGFEVLAFDRPGFGLSDPGDRAVVSLQEQSRVLAALLPQDDRPTVLLGHSFGGAVAAWAAAAFPRQVAALILVSAALDPAQEKVLAIQKLAARAPLRALLPRAVRHSNAELIALKRELEALSLRLVHVCCPVAMLHGTEDYLVPVENLRFMQARLLNASRVKAERLEGRNHFLPWNSEHELRQAIAWIRSCLC